MPQIWLNIQRGNTGQLSLLTSGLSFAGNCVRVFTTAVLTNDVVLLAATGVQVVLNGVLTWQCVQTELESRRARAACGGQRPDRRNAALNP